MNTTFVSTLFLGTSLPVGIRKLFRYGNVAARNGMNRLPTILNAHAKLFAREWLTIVEQRFLYFEVVLQNVDNVINIRAERIASLDGMPELDLSSHDFH